ncbi:MAG: TIGR00730 family Rossman fold protein [Dehalococcoidia bacterium]|nr:TIGR00730 family Rossman fold protein [Dehalococcoidia bacterium]
MGKGRSGVIPTADRWDRRFLEGPEPRPFGLMQAIRVFFSMIRGFRAFHFLGPCVTVFGSARIAEAHPYYDLARRAGRELARGGFTVMTGGGPGIMEAANRGAREAGGRSVGCGIHLQVEQAPNPYLDRYIECGYFFVRKLMLIKYSYAFIALPGGFGTLDEIFEAVTLIQTGKIRDFPVVLLGSEFWGPLIDFMRDTLVAQRTIDAADFDRLIVTDSPEEAASLIHEAAIRRFGLRYADQPRRRWFLFE